MSPEHPLAYALAGKSGEERTPQVFRAGAVRQEHVDARVTIQQLRLRDWDVEPLTDSFALAHTALDGFHYSLRGSRE